jgi:PAS domain S-box-containing protein
VEKHRTATHDINYLYRVKHKNGTWRFWRDHATPVLDSQNRPLRWVGGISDITEHKEAEETIRESEARFRELADMLPQIVFETDIDGNLTFVNQNAYDTFGYTKEDFALGLNATQMIGIEDRDRAANRIRQIMAGEANLMGSEYTAVKKNGEDFPVVIYSNRFLRDGVPAGLRGIIIDITQRKQMEQDLFAEKERLSVTLRSIGDAVITTDREGQIVLMNPVAEALTGWSEADALGRPLMEVFQIVNERNGEPYASPVDKVLASGQVLAMGNHTMIISRYGQEHIIADSGAPITDTTGETIGVVLVFRDITDQQRLEKELLKVEKLKSLGVLAGGIAHDFNNFLTGILGNLSLAKIDLEPGNPVSRALNEMEKATVRATDLTQQLLTFSRGGKPVKRTIGIADLVREAVQFALRGSNVRCKFDIDEKLMPVDVDEGQIGQVIHNLILNADQAMPNGGTVWIRGANVSLAKGNPFALSPGNYVQVAVQDQGMGIHPNYLKKVFDPYFTTKQKESGLGLAVAYNVVAKHDGQLTVDSELGKGATFTILLPASTIGPQACSEKREAILNGQGRVLVMDDEDFIRELASAMLNKMGYVVALAKDGQQALMMYREALDAGKPFDAVILDLTVPGGMGGKETVHHLAAVDPHVRAIVSSGYSNDPIMANHVDHGFCAAVKKPYLVEEMSQVLNKVIIRKNNSPS